MHATNIFVLDNELITFKYFRLNYSLVFTNFDRNKGN